jgi:enamine deaminase RidA (YjgF/YER057c/UK114 family)
MGLSHLGQVGEDSAGKIPNDFDAEVRQCLENIGAALKAGGMPPDDVVSVQVYVTGAAKFERVNVVYTSHSKDPRTTVVVAGPVGSGSIEITVTAGK